MENVEFGLLRVIERIKEINSKFSHSSHSNEVNRLNKNFKDILLEEVEKNNNLELTQQKDNNSLVNTAKSNSINSKNEEIYSLVEELAKKYNISTDLIHAVIKAESNYNVNALSPKGAMGLMQLMPSTAIELGVKNPWDIKENLEGGIKYLSSLLMKYKGDLKLALAAYNAGPANVDSFSGVPPFQETNFYINKVLKLLNRK